MTQETRRIDDYTIVLAVLVGLSMALQERNSCMYNVQKQLSATLLGLKKLSKVSFTEERKV